LDKAYKSADMEKAKQIQDVLCDADLAQSKLGVSGLKLAVSHYFGYGSGQARSPLPSGSESALAGQKSILDELIQLEKSL
jgi:4-hydroxy-2-oxoglutarate aldolase